MSKILNLRNNLMFLLFIFFLVLNFAFAAFAKPATQPTQKDFIHIDVWKNKIKQNLPNDICDAGSFFRNCYEINEQKCVDASRNGISQCMSNFKLPQKINPYGEGVKLAYKIGMCAGKKIDQTLKSYRREDDEKCVNGRSH